MKKVEIYSTEYCGYCKLAKEFFEKNNIDYIEHNVGENETKRKEMIEKTGQMGVPVIIIEDEIIVGFDEPRLRQLLNMRL